MCSYNTKGRVSLVIEAEEEVEERCIFCYKEMNIF